MITDIIQYSTDSFTCNECGEKFAPGTLVNVFRWDGKTHLFCMKCLELMSLTDDIIWVAETETDPRMRPPIPKNGEV